MYDETYGRIGVSPRTAVREGVMGQVLGLLGFSFAFTAAGAGLGMRLGAGAFIPALLASLGALVALYLLRERSPLNLGLLYLFATGEGVTLGLLLQSYLAAGLGGLVVTAAGTTAAITLTAGWYGATTRRDLTRLGGILFVGLIGVVVAGLLGLFIHLPLLHLGIAMVAAVLFTGFLVYDFQRLATTRAASSGDVVMLAVAIYLDIFNLFVSLLTILQGLSGSSRD